MKDKTLTSIDLVRKAKERSGLSQEVLRQSLRALLGAISEVMDDGNNVALDNFGSFEQRKVKERTVTPPPPNNKPIVVPEHQVVRFRPYKNILIYHIKY